MRQAQPSAAKKVDPRCAGALRERRMGQQRAKQKGDGSHQEWGASERPCSGKAFHLCATSVLHFARPIFAVAHCGRCGPAPLTDAKIGGEIRRYNVTVFQASLHQVAAAKDACSSFGPRNTVIFSKSSARHSRSRSSA